MKKLSFAASALILFFFIVGETEAGSNGDSPQDGEDWIITQDTELWDEEISVKDIIVNLGSKLKLDNVSLSAEGEIEIRGETTWLNSTIYHQQGIATDNISIYNKLEIINSEFTIKPSEENTHPDANRVYLHSGSQFVVSDFDSDPLTLEDSSIIKTDVSEKGAEAKKTNYTVEIGIFPRVPETVVQIENSMFQYIRALRFEGEGSFVQNSSFEEFGLFNVAVDNFVFTNNTVKDSFAYSELYLEGDNAIIQNNTLINGSWGMHLKGNFTNISNNSFLDYAFPANYQGGESAVRLSDGHNSTIQNNYFSNFSIHAITLDRTEDINVYGNNFEDAGGGWHTVMVRSSFRSNFNNNTFTDCFRDGAPWYQTCLIFYRYNSTVYKGGSHTVENNTFTNYQSAVRVLSFQDNNTIQYNIFETGFHSVGLWNWPGGESTAPSGNLIKHNSMNNTNYPIAMDYHYQGISGVDNSVLSNYISNCTVRSIVVWNYYKNFTIENNVIVNSTQGIWIYNDGVGDVRNGLIKNNAIHTQNQGIISNSDYTALIDNLTIINNTIVTTEGNAAGNGLNLLDLSDSYIANNTITTNSTAGSSAAGMFIYFNPNLQVVNNTLYSSIGIEVGGVSDRTTPYIFSNNKLYVTDYGILSNNTYAEIYDNFIEGTCDHEQCDILYLAKVSKSGIFSQEGNIKIENNTITNFKETFGLFITDFEILLNEVNFSETAFTINNSVGSLENNFIQNTTESVNSYRSNLKIENNTFSNFEKGILIFNSSIDLKNNIFMEGDLCLDVIDSDYILSGNDFSCRDTEYLIRYNIRINIADEEGIGPKDLDFKILNSLGEVIVDSQTKSEGYTDYYLINIMAKSPDSEVISSNPLKIIYNNNEVEVKIFKNLTYNHTVFGLLDTRSPISILEGGEYLSNSTTINLRIKIVNNPLDFDYYILEYLVNVEFSEWETYGIFTEENITFEGTNSKEYRFRSRAVDIYGNTESKTDYEYQVKIDSEFPFTQVLNLNENYYFTGNNMIDFEWISDDDVDYTSIYVSYTNFTDPYLNIDSVTWELVDTIIVYAGETYQYALGKKGHYGFTLTSTDIAGNIENKKEFDVVFNFNSKSDTISFSEVPGRWGSDVLEIDYVTSNFNLDFEIMVALESISNSNGYLTWYSYEHNINEGKLALEGLQDDTRYYMYAISRDLAGNVENPLNTLEYFSSSGQYDQKYRLKYEPLLDWNYTFQILVDNDLSGDYETILERGMDQSKLLPNQFYLDYENNTVLFGGVLTGGFVPNEDIEGLNNIKVVYSGVHAIFEVYTGEPESANQLNVIPTNTTQIVVKFSVPKDMKECKIQRTTNISKGWFNQEIISPCAGGIKEYIHNNPDLDEIYFYRIVIEDEFGHSSPSEHRSVDMQEVVKLYSSTESNDNEIFGMDSIIPITALVGIVMLSFGGVLLYQSKRADELDENVSVIESKPVAKYKVEELYLIYKDGRLIKNLSDVESKTDSDIMSGMLTAINDFVQDSFNTEGDLGSIDYGNNKIILQRGGNSYLAAVIYGEIDNVFKGKMINAVRNIEKINSSMNTWDGASESIVQTEIYMKPIIQETQQATREMVDNYFSEKEIVLTANYDKEGDIVNLKVHLSNYSSNKISDCKLKAEFNSLNLNLIGIEPDVFYSFADNSFVIGDLESYNEVHFNLKFQARNSNPTTIDVSLKYVQKGREGDINSVIELI